MSTSQHKGVSASNLAEMYRLAAEKYGDLPAFGTRVRSGVFKPISYRDLYDYGLFLGSALIELGIQARDHVALLSDNRVEWNISDYAIIMIGAADVPRGTDVTNQELEYIINHSDSEVVFVENMRLLERVISLMPKFQKTRHLVLMDSTAQSPDGVFSMQKLIERGRELRNGGNRQVEERMESINSTDLFTLIYTSGTTGVPKGVMLTHANMASQVRNLPFSLEPADRLLSILPVWHSYERVFQMIAISNGCCTYFTSLRSLADDMKTVKPTIMASAPRLWENLYLRIIKNVRESHWIRRMLFHSAYFCSRMFKGSVFFLQGKKIDLFGRSIFQSIFLGIVHAIRAVIFSAPFVVLNAVVLEKLRLVVGGSFKGTVSGGGALQPHVDEFFNYIGIPVREGYGLTETSPVVAVRTDPKLIIGTVGPLYNETSIRIVDLNSGEVLYPNPAKRKEGRGLKGEIHVKGPQVMLGYYKNPEATERVLHDGWLNTGDIGILTHNDCLKIVGRSKDTIVLLNAENIEPIPIESKICESPFIDQCMVVGQDQKQLGVLVVPSLEGFQAQGNDATSVSDLANRSGTRDRVAAEVKRLISVDNGFKPFEHIHEIALLPKTFEIGNEMTSTFKIKRHVVNEKYAELIHSLYI